jgi:hypothetical protein
LEFRRLTLNNPIRHFLLTISTPVREAHTQIAASMVTPVKALIAKVRKEQ